ncbi:hypothetical protein RFI_39657, partial [Reticulomyxa filosa]
MIVFGTSTAMLIDTLDHYTYPLSYQWNVFPASLQQHQKHIVMEYLLPLHVINNYGLFRQMTGVGGRPEIELFVSDASAVIPIDNDEDEQTTLSHHFIRHYRHSEADASKDSTGSTVSAHTPFSSPRWTRIVNKTMHSKAFARNSRAWYPVPFLFKPGDLFQASASIIPHQPRLDWQMWFAALGGHFQQVPWFISFVYRLVNAPL